LGGGYALRPLPLGAVPAVGTIDSEPVDCVMRFKAGVKMTGAVTLLTRACNTCAGAALIIGGEWTRKGTDEG